MIKGKSVPITDQYRIEHLSESYIDFISLINTLEIELIKEAKTKIIYINSYSLKNYGLLLKSEFENTIRQIEHHIDILQSKDHKIIELRNYTTDFGTLFPFINEKSDLLFHKNVSFKNLPAKRSKKDIQANKQIQECCQNIDFFTKRLNVFFTDLKNSIHTDTTSTTSHDSELDASSPSIENPFAFFEYVFQSNGIIESIRNFEPVEEDILNHGIEYNKETLIKSYPDRDDNGDWIRHEVRFIDTLKISVNNQLRVAKSCLKRKIDLIGDLSAVSAYMLHSLNSLIRMHENQLPGVDIQHKAVCQESIQKMITYIDRHYQVYLKPRSISIIKNFQQKIYNKTNATQIIDSGPAYHFTIKGIAKDKFLLQAWQLFIKECISEKDYKLYLNVFEGSIKQEKLRKIKWLSKYKGYPFIKPLVYFFNKLIQLNIIDETETSLKSKLQILFADYQDRDLKNVQTKFTQYKKDPGYYPEIDKLLDFTAKSLTAS
jgi:hypothetical protein